MLERFDDLPKYEKPSDPLDYRGFIRYRHTKTLSDLQEAFGRKAQEKGIFDAWMGELSDEIQLAARAYGEYICAEAIVLPKDAIIKDTAELFMLNIIKTDAAWFLLSETLTREQIQVINARWTAAVHAFDQHAETWVEAFMIPEGLVHAPIARDWTKYNEHDNFGEVIKSKY